MRSIRIRQPSTRPLRATIRMCAGRGRPTRSDEEDERSPAQHLLTSLRNPRRLPLAILLLAITGGLVVAFIYARGELAGSDALAYWTGVQRWLAGEDIYLVNPGLYVAPPVPLPLSLIHISEPTRPY